MVLTAASYLSSIFKDPAERTLRIKISGRMIQIRSIRYREPVDISTSHTDMCHVCMGLSVCRPDLGIQYVVVPLQ